MAAPRAWRIIDILHRKPGDILDAGLLDGPQGKATLVEIAPGNGALDLAFI